MPLPQPAPTAVRLRLIGQMEAWTLAGESLLPTGRKTRGLLAVIGLSAPRPVLRSRVAELLWSRRPEEQARASLRQEIHRLLEALNPLGTDILAITRDHLAIRPGTVWIDVEEVQRATPSRPAALGLFSGDLLEDLDGIDPAFDVWLGGERERLRDRARALGEVLLRGQNEPESVIVSAQQLLSIDRSHEGAWRALMRAYHARGERGMAIQSYDRCRAVLADQLDAQPSIETQRLLAELKSNPAPAFGSVTGLLATATPPQDGPRGAPRPPSRPARAQPGMLSFPDDPPGPAPRPPSGPQTRPEIRPETRTETRTGTVALPPLQGPRGGVRLGVLPLRLVSTTDAEAHLATGLADEITAALARFRGLSLTSSSAIARMTADDPDGDATRRVLGLDLVVDGTAQRAGDRLRITLRLLDLRAGNQVVWCGKFDRSAADLLTLQDEVAAEVAARIDPEILLLESTRAILRSPAGFNAHDLMLRALPLISRFERATFMRAGDLLAQAVALEPDHAAAHAWYAYWHVFLVGQFWNEDQAPLLAEAGRLAERAIMLDPQDAKALTIAGHVRAHLHGRLREGMSLHQRALALNPNLAMAWSLSGVAASYMGDHEDAERRVARYRQLSPLDPQAFFFGTARVVVALMQRRHQQAAEMGREVTEMNPMFSASLKPTLAALGHLGAQDDAAALRQRLLALEPGFTVRRFLERTPFERPPDRAHFAAGLRLAGIAE